MNAEQVIRGLESLYLRYKAGLVSGGQAREELAILKATLKAYELAVVEEKCNRIADILEGRKG